MTSTIRLYLSDSYMVLLKTALLISVLFLAACSTTKAPEPAFDRVQQKGMPPLYVIADVPFVSQSDHYCGPASLAMMLQHYGHNISEAEAAEMVYTSGRSGTFQHDMVTAIPRNGFVAIKMDELDKVIEEIHAGNPVLVFQNLSFSWAPQWHYAVITGYDFTRNGFYLHSGKRKNHFVSFKTFGKTWDKGGRWAFVVASPDRLPGTAALPDLLEAMVQLENAGEVEAALTGYYSIVHKYPYSHKGWFGIANIMMLKKNYKRAETAYRLSLDFKPSIYAYNNMAYALRGQGKIRQACKLLADAITSPLFSSEQKGGQDMFREELFDTQNEICRNS